MRSGVPWSVKGIEPEAREAAKQAARRAGVTLGAWLNQVIMDGGTDEVGMADQNATRQAPLAPAATYTQATPQPTASRSTEAELAPVAQAVRDIVARVEQSERRTQDLSRRMEQSVGMLAERLEGTERHMDETMHDPRAYDPLERKIQQLAERLEQAEHGRGGGRKSYDDNKAQLQTLEKAVNAVVDHLETAERRTDESLSDIRRTLSEIAGRVDEHEEEEAREEAEERARAAEQTMQLLAQRLEKMEHSVTNVGGQAVDAALKAIAEKDDEARNKATIDNLQNHLSEITQRLERAEKRTDETLKTFELTVTGIARRLEELDATRDQQLGQEVDTRLEEMAQRLYQSEEMSLSAAQTIERAIAGMSESLNSSDARSRETIDNLNVMLERMTDRLGRIERETKATRTTIKQTAASGALSPQLMVGAPMAGTSAGFVPGGQSFPIPNFDAPSLGGNDPLSDYRQAETPQAPLAAKSSDSYRSLLDEDRSAPSGADDLPPPPFAPEADSHHHHTAGNRIEPRLDATPLADDDIEDELEDEAPVDEGARVAENFMAAARRAAQNAAINGRGGPQPMAGTGGYAQAVPGRFNAMDQGDSQRKNKIILGSIAAVIAIAIAFGAFRMMAEEPVIVSTTAPDATGQAADELAPANMAASTETTSTSAVPTTVPSGPSTPQTTTNPEATPEGVDAKAAAAASTSTTSPTNVVTPVAKPQHTSKQSNNEVTEGPARKAGPQVSAAPAEPVTSSPLNNVPAAERDLRAAAVAGNAAAQYEVGQRYANGENVPQDLEQAAYWYNQAADQGLAIAQYRLAAQYEKGRGVAQDNAKARSLYEKAAAKGNVKAMHNLAVIFAEGRGTRQDFSSAAKWFNAAADYGLGDSQYNLAILQERGLGVSQDLVLAYKWLGIAANGGDKGAAQKRDEIGSKLDATKLAEGKMEIETWRAKRPDPIANGDLSSMGSWANAMIGDMTASITPSEAATRNDIGKAQAMLIKLGYNPGSSDGLMGPRTRDAIIAYQKSASLDQTGSVNPALLKSLEIATR